METRKISSTQWLVAVVITLLIALIGVSYYLIVNLFTHNVAVPKIILFYVLLAGGTTITVIGIHWRRYQYILFLRTIKQQLQSNSTIATKDISKSNLLVIRSILIDAIVFIGIFILFSLIDKRMSIGESCVFGVGVVILATIIQYPEYYQKFLVRIVEPHLHEEQKTYLQQFKIKWYDYLYFLIIALIAILIYFFT